MKHQQPLKEDVLSAIAKGKVTMRPHWHFVLKTALLIIGSVLVFCTLVFLVSFMLFMMRRSGILFVPAFGLRGWYALLRDLPWILIGLSIIFLILLELLVQRYAFAYRRPLLYSVFSIIVVSTLLSTFASPLHNQFSLYVERNNVPGAQYFYRSLGRPRLVDVHGGTISEFVPTGFILQDFRSEPLMIIITRHTRLPDGDDFTVGESVVVFGDRTGNQVEAYGIRALGE